MADKEYEINIDPKILELLGPSLYTNIYYILAELIANAYDANAENVYIIEKDGSITVEDDGHGMSYIDGDIKKYLNVANETRKNEEDAFVKGSNKSRRKMGRKGVGKLAALSVSEDVMIMTRRNGEISGFILSRNVGDDHKLMRIEDENIVFKKIKENGTSIVMNSPQYSLHKTSAAIKNNLLKIFPLVNDDFKIHVEVRGKTFSIDSFERELIKGLGGLIVLGESFEYVADSFDPQLPKNILHKEVLLQKREPFKKDIELRKKNGEKSIYTLEICGWIGAYRSVKGRKKDRSDFPDNFISILSNKKLGEFNILPLVGNNELTEVYVVGQLHVELLENSDLPDMALSNRQGYKSDDIRYRELIKYVSSRLLPDILNLRKKYADFNRQTKELKVLERSRFEEEKLKAQIDKFKDQASTEAANSIISFWKKSGAEGPEIAKMVSDAINDSFPDMGLKRKVDDLKKKLLISQTILDKPVSDLIYNLLIFSGVSPSEIIYSNCNNSEARLPHNVDIYNYLADFFVDSYSTQKIFVVYITSNNMADSWGAICEVGGGWVTKKDHEIININGYSPQQPLHVNKVWANVQTKDDSGVVMGVLEADVLAEKIVLISSAIGFNIKSKHEVLQEILRLVDIS